MNYEKATILSTLSKIQNDDLVVDESYSMFPEMVPPFTAVDREEDYWVVWKFFEERLAKERGEPESRLGIEKVE